MKINRSSIIILLVLVVVAGLPACAPSAPAEPVVETKEVKVTELVEVTSVPEPTEVPPPTHITYVIGFAPSLIDGFIYPVVDRFGPEEGLDVEVVVAQGSLDSIKFAVVGRADFASANVIANATAWAQGLPAVDVFDAYQKYDFGIVSLPDSGITSVADLEGKKVGFVSFSSATYPNLYAMLATAGLGEDDITPVVAGFNLPAALSEGKVDAISSWETQWSGMLAQGFEINIIRGDQFLDWDGGGIFVNFKVIEDNPDLVKRFVRALYKSFVYSKAYPEESLEIIAEYIPEVTDNQAASLETWKNVVNAAFAGAAETNGLGWIDVTRRQSQSDFLFELGVIDNQPDMTGSVTNQFVEIVQEELKDWEPTP